MDLENKTGDAVPLLDKEQKIEVSEETVNLINKTLSPSKNYPEGFPNLRIEVADFVLTIQCFECFECF